MNSFRFWVSVLTKISIIPDRMKSGISEELLFSDALIILSGIDTNRQ